ncbi:unnamed protein product [Cladocopium goreaui]|uniref:DUF1415 domain-containing protein n=1 Tax=Cladocopium goreaui TaxID=2562237 RepID=A0A9P1GIE2_9DINO|nr:unnamed protein product [Cladocopium goreaui]
MEKPMGNHWGTTDFGILVQAKAVAQWVRRVVVRHGLCPWAEEALRRGSLAVVTLDEESEEEVAAAVLAHAQLLAGLGTSPTAATTLLVAPKCGSLQDFEVYLHLCAWLEEAFEELELNGKVQLATFHPDFRFADSAGPNDAADFVGRAPAPAFHLLREKERRLNSLLRVLNFRHLAVLESFNQAWVEPF